MNTVKKCQGVYRVPNTPDGDTGGTGTDARRKRARIPPDQIAVLRDRRELQMSVSGIGGLGVDMLQARLQLDGQKEVNGGPRPPGGGHMGPPQLWTDIQDSAATAGLNAEEIDGLKSGIKDAISTALESVDRSEGPEAARSAVDSAILGVLQDNGIDTAEIESRMEAAHAKMQGMRSSAQQPGGFLSGNSVAGDGASTLLSLVGSEQDPASAALASIFPFVDERV